MGKNSNAHKSKATTNMDIEREREDDARRAAIRLRKESKLREAAGEMDVAETADASAEAAIGKSKKKFGKVMLKKRAKINPSAMPIGKSLGPKKRLKGAIRKPSGIMKKTLKKLAKKREMDMS